MNLIKLNLSLDKEPAVNPVIYLGQGDVNGTRLECSIYEDGQAFSLTGCTAKFKMRLPGGTASYEVASTSLSGNVATFTVDEQAAALFAGKTCIAYVQIAKAGATFSTTRAEVIVLEGAEV